MQRSRSLNNRLVAFAPTYEGMEIDDSVLAAGPPCRGEIRELPAALIEAEDAVISAVAGLIGNEASEGTFKREAPGTTISFTWQCIHSLMTAGLPFQGCSLPAMRIAVMTECSTPTRFTASRSRQ
jgi:hypothetical protein